MNKAFGIVDGVYPNAEVFLGFFSGGQSINGEKRELELIVVALYFSLILGFLFSNDFYCGVVLTEASNKHGLYLEVSLG